MSAAPKRMPVYYLSHGGGPWPWLAGPMRDAMAQLEESLQNLPGELPEAPEAILMVSAHWETANTFAVQTNPNPPMVYDYGGFPPETYEIQYSAPGSPALASRVQSLLRCAGIPIVGNAKRGFDHGAFAPLAAAWPDADVPVVQLSIERSYDPATHLAVGRALAPLRDEGVLILGSGLSYHNLGQIMDPRAEVPSREFDDWLGQTVLASDPADRTARIQQWAQAPSARMAHPQEDHLIPLMIAIGAAESDHAVRSYHQHDFFGHVTASSFRFDSAPERNPMSDLDAAPAEQAPSPPQVGRRRALGLLGASVGAAVLAACGKGSGGGTTSSSTASSTSTTAAETAGGAASATGGGASAAGGLTAASFGGAASCKATVEQTAGPYYIDVDKIRGDIREDRSGVELRVAARVLDVDGCTPIENAVFEIWHCDAEGLYSGFESASAGGRGSTDSKRYLRGAQVTNADGIAVITTIYPGWYQGRSPHIHAKVALTNTDLLTTQLYFDDTITDEVYEAAPYRNRPNRSTRNDDDGIYQPGTTLTISKDGDAYVGLITIGVQA